MTASTPTPQPYPAYRPSGVEWLGDLPAHWDLRRLKSLGRIVNGATPSSGVPHYWDGNIVWITPEDLGQLTDRHISRGQRQITQAGYDSCSTTFAPAGSIVISTRAPIGNTAILERPACVNQGCRLFVPGPDAQTEYIHYAFVTAKEYLMALGKGSTFLELSQSSLGNADFPCPPAEEQAAIVRFLDQADGGISRYVSAKERLVALLEEQRQAVIHQAVTRGLDANAPLKPSGAPWLGDVPAHWEIMPLKHWVFINREILPETTPRDHLIRYIEISDVSGHTLTEQPRPLAFGDAPSRARRIVKSGDTIISTVRTYLKAVWFSDSAPDNLVCSTGFAVLTPRPDTAPKFVSYLARSDSFTNRVTAESIGIAYPAISESRLGSFPVCVPPMDEQAAIAAYLDEATAETDAAIVRARRQVELMQEYRTRLIADAVTGKMDVRHAKELR